jgi:hypothetical protein
MKYEPLSVDYFERAKDLLMANQQPECNVTDFRNIWIQ